MGAIAAAQVGARRRFCLVLVKPSHYDDDGYVIQWLRSPVPSNSLAALYGLAKDCAERRVLGDDVDIEIHAFDEINTRIRPERLAAMIEEAGAGMVMLAGVQSNQFPRALDMRGRCARAASRSASAASTSPACCRCSAASMPISTAPGPWACRCSRARRKAGSNWCCATPPRARSSRSTITWRSAGYRGHADPAAAGRARAAHHRRHHQLRRRPRLPLPVLVLHHHQRAGAQVAPPLAGRRRAASCG